MKKQPRFSRIYSNGQFGIVHGHPDHLIRDFFKSILRWIATFYLAGWGMVALASEGGDIYKKACAVCHAAGVPGIPDAPKLRTRNDPDFGENWNRRLFAGREALLHSVLDGKGAMPPKGGDASLSDKQAEAALDYMLLQMENSK